MQVDEKLIRHVAHVARLNLTDKEVKEFVPQFKEILDTFSIIASVNTDGVEPSMQPVEVKNHLRDDVLEKSLSNDEALKNSEHKKDGYFLGPKAV